MRGLQGDLQTMSLQELAVHLAQKRASGTLKFTSAEVDKEITLAEGAVVNARSNLAREYLGQFLINVGLLTEDQFHKAYETQKETRIYIGKILVMIGAVTEEQVANALSLKFRETVLSAFEWTEGSFSFVPEAPATLLEGVELQVPLEDILKEAEFRETAWRSIRAAFPSGELKLSFHPEKLPAPLEPGSVDAKIVAMIEDDLTLDEIGLGLHATDFFLYQRLYALNRLEAVTVRAPEVAKKAAPPALIIGLEPTAEEMAATANALIESGNARDAAALASRAFELAPTPANKELKRRAETLLLVALRRELLRDDLLPKLNVSSEDLKRMALSAPQRYLISRVDGVRTLRSIVQASPLPELDALRAFRDFVDGQLLSLQARAA
jgi:hypothetical protein